MTSERIPPIWRQTIETVMQVHGLKRENLMEPLLVETVEAVNRYFSGRSQLDLQQASSMATFLGITLDEMMCEPSLNPTTNRGQRVRALRVDCDLSQAELAELCGIEQATISDIERNNAATVHIVKIANALGTTAEYIEGGTSSRFSGEPSALAGVSLKQEELALLELFRCLSNPLKSKALRLLMCLKD